MTGKIAPLKIVTLVGTRPEIIKLSMVISELERHCDHVLVHSGQNYDYELNRVFFDELGISNPRHFLHAAGGTSAETIANVISRFDSVLERERPDAVLIYGDTNSCLGVIAAKRRKVPIFHMEAGNRCFDQRVPEELNRKIVDHLSDVNMTNSEHARRYLLAEGIKPDFIVKTGSPMKEVLSHHHGQIMSSDVLIRLGLTPARYVLVSCHREETVDVPERLATLVHVLHTIADEFQLPVLVSTHPRTRKRLDEAGLDLELFAERIQFVKPFGFLDYVRLEMDAACVVSDSGTLTEESTLLGFPAVMIREAHERPEGMDEGVLIFSGLRSCRVIQAMTIAMSQRDIAKPIVSDYDVDSVSRVVLGTIVSYVDYVNRLVWSKQDGPLNRTETR